MSRFEKSMFPLSPFLHVKGSVKVRALEFEGEALKETASTFAMGVGQHT